LYLLNLSKKGVEMEKLKKERKFKNFFEKSQTCLEKEIREAKELEEEIKREQKAKIVSNKLKQFETKVKAINELTINLKKFLPIYVKICNKINSSHCHSR